MKNIILVIFTALCFIYCNSQVKKEIQLQGDLKKENLKGNVQSVLTKKYSVVEKFGEIQKEKMLENKLFLYDDNGNITEEKIYDKSDNLKNVIQFTYNDKGKKTFKRYEESALNGTSLVEFGYDENGYLVYERSFNQNFEELSPIQLYENDEKGILKQSTTLLVLADENNKIIFDDKGKLQGVNAYEVISFIYNNKGEVVEEKGEYIVGDNYHKKIRYNQNGDVIEEKEEKQYPERDYVYNEHTKSFEGKNTGKIMNKTEIIKFEYTYDVHNNWITRIEYQGIKPITKTERIIKYR